MTTIGKKYRGKKEFQLVYSKLINAAQYCGIVTYQEIARIMNLPLQGNLMGREVGQILGEISEDENKYGRPMLSAVVVGVTGYPGEGFYTLAKSLGKLNSDDEEEKYNFWKAERNDVYETWKVKL